MTAETELRALWTEQGVPQGRQDELIDQIRAKAAPGAMVGPFRISGGDGLIRPDSLKVVRLSRPLLPGDAITMAINYEQVAGDTRANADREARSKEKGASRRAASLRDKATRLDACAADLRRAVKDHFAVRQFRSELTDAGEQTVIPGCERDDERTGQTQMSLF